MTKTIGYKISWTNAQGVEQKIVVHTLRAARLLLNNLITDRGAYDARLSPIRRSFNEIVISFDGCNTRKL